MLIERHEQQVLFDQAFDLFWRNPKLLERMMALLLPKVRGRVPADEAQAPLPARLAEAMAPPRAAELEVEGDEDRSRRGVHVLAARGAADARFRIDDGRRARARSRR